MKPEAPMDINRIFVEEGYLIDEALRKGAREAILRHKKEGFPIVVWRDGKSVWIPPDEIDDYLAAQDAKSVVGVGFKLNTPPGYRPGEDQTTGGLSMRQPR